jgi:hypothetical protein
LHSGQAAAKQPAESYWRSFPLMEKVLGQEHPALLNQLQATCRLLDTAGKSGSPQEHARARAAITAYARALELYRELAGRRDQAIAQAQPRQGSAR